MVYSAHPFLYRQVVFPMKVLKDKLAALAMTSNLFCSNVIVLRDINSGSTDLH